MTHFLRDRKILITGATGFIGANLARRCLEAGAKVSIFTRPTSDRWRIKDVLNRLHEHDVDILDEKVVGRTVSKVRPEIIFHAAAYGSHAFQREEDRIIRTNVLGTTNLMRACARRGFDIFINTGSSSEYGAKTRPMKETDVLEPQTPYGASKSFATLYCQMKAKRDRLPVVTLRLFSPYGYFDAATRLVATVIAACLRAKEPALSSQRSVRDFIFIEDVVDAYFKAVERKKQAQGEIFNIGTGKQHSLRQVVSCILGLTASSVNPRWHSIPSFRFESKSWEADITKAREFLGWQPRHGLETGLQKTIDWFGENMRFYPLGHS